MTKQYCLIAVFLAISLCNVFGQSLSNEYKAMIANFIYNIQNDRKDKIADMINYPFKRQYPIPSIKDKNEFIKRFNEVFDDTIKSRITASNPGSDWSEVGWRGIMLNNGDIWIDTEGHLIAVNLQSTTEKLLRESIISIDKQNLHPSISNFLNPICLLETAKYRVRIDEIDTGKYRYVSWPLAKSMTDKPDLVLLNGQFIPDGTGGNHYYDFMNGDYKYSCYIIVLGDSFSPPARLEIYKGDKLILSQDATLIKK